MDEPKSSALAWSWAFLVRMLSGIREPFGLDVRRSAFLPVEAWRRLAREIRYLERLARRLILIKAYALDLGPSGLRSPSLKSSSAASKRPSGLGFRLFEALSPIPGAAEAIASAPPAIEAGPLLRDGSRLLQRISALEAMVEHPERCERRLARWRRNKRGRRTMAIRLWPMPERRRATVCLYASTLVHAHDMAVAAMNTHPPWKLRPL